MPTVRALVSIQTTKGIIPPGRIITIPDAVLDRLKGKVEIIGETTAPYPAERISRVLAEIEAHRPPQVDVWSLLTWKAQQRIQAANHAIDSAAPEDLDEVLEAYRQTWREILAEIRTPEPPETCRCCNGQDFWQGAGKTVCRRCHPPAPGAERVLKREEPSHFNNSPFP